MPATPGNLSLERRTTINDGTAFQSGTVDGLTWQASGTARIIESGCTLSTITDCYHMYLTSDPSEQLDPGHLDSPRQRDEFHFPKVSAGTQFTYTWKQYLYASTGTGSSWFHIMQAFGSNEDGPLVTLDAVSGTLGIKNYFRDTAGPTTDLANYHGKTTTHHISGKFGPSRSLSYTITNDEGSTILSYNVTGGLGADGGYIKFGLYRLTFNGMTTAK
ncbi:hypothetical protein C8R45DRAFT_813063 [Mycena sanguinolenta]|nr:hypothetical protein C8R45DRAFT_813063 [Mycena sanguinolenta]